MPCNGVAVATAKISNDLAQYLALLPQETINQAAQTYLRNQFGLESFTSRVYGNIIIIASGSYTVDLNYKTGQVKVRGRLSANREFMERIQQGLIDLLSGLAGYALQQDLIRKVSSQVIITGQQTAPNGATVLEVEI